MEKTKSHLRVLIVEDSDQAVVLLQRHLEALGYFVRSCHVRNAREMSAALDQQPWDIVLADHEMPEFDSVGALDLLKKRRPDIPFVVVSGSVCDGLAADLMNAGACDFIPKTQLVRLQPVIEREMRGIRSRRNSAHLETEVGVVNRQLEETFCMLTKTQEQLVRVERFKALGQMASGVAHDFNNALTKMVGIVELAIAQSEESRQPLEQLRVTVMDAANIVRRLRAFYGPIGAGDDAEALEVNKVIEASVMLTKPKWKAQSAANGHPITVRMNLGSVPCVAGKAGELQEALANLIFNACDALPSGGTISVSTSVEGDTVTLEVKDDGIGMSEEDRRRCLEPYFTTKGKTRTGMGLAMVDGLIRRYGGSLDFETCPGEGSSFKLHMPVFHEAEENAGKEEELPTQVAPMKILVVDDDLAISILISQFLRLDGHEVEIAKDGQKALDRFDPEHHQIVISDRAMPVVNGDLLAAAIKSRAPETPVIMASGFVDAMTDEDERPPGVDYLLRKPITREDLRKAIAKVSAASETCRVGAERPSIS